MNLFFDAPTKAYIRIKDTEYNELVKSYGKELADKIVNSKSGYLTIDKGTQHASGLCIIFTEGLACYLSNPDEWYRTSNIQKIDWDKQEFTTKNSVYKFIFEEIPFNDLKSMYYDTSEG